VVDHFALAVDQVDGVALTSHQVLDAAVEHAVRTLAEPEKAGHAARALAALADEGLKRNKLMNVSLINDTFDHALSSLLPQTPRKTMVFVDGNHSLTATLRYAGFFLSAIPDGSLIVFDDINWSDGMRKAWKEIKANENGTFTIDLFSMGIVFIKHGFFKENYTIRF